MPFGLHTATATFQRLLDQVITPDLAPYVFAYLDDIIIISSTFEEHIRLLKEVFKRLRAANLRPNPEKCQFGRRQLRYLGHMINEDGLQTDPEMVSAVENLPPPTNPKEVRRFTGLLSWYRRFIPNVAQLTAPLNKLLRKKATWEWGKAQQEAFEALKNSLTKAPVLACPDWTRTFFLQTDASKEGLGVVLTQNTNEGERVIAYASRSLTNAERNYSVTELECLAVKWGIWKMREYLEGYHFVVITDHQSLKWLNNIENSSGRLARWAMELSQYDFEIKYRKGSENTVADALSRQPLPTGGVSTPSQCAWYQRIYKAVQEKPENHPEYCIRNNRLYRHFLHTLDFKDNDPADEWKMCIPAEQRPKVLKEIHDDPTAGHLGVAKTVARAMRSYYWPHMRNHVTKYVRRCENCQKNKTQQLAPAGVMHATNVNEPWEMVSVDLVGTLPRSTNGMNMLLVMQDRFTKWIELRPLRKATAPAIIKAIKELVVLRHGCPKTIVSDNGKQFVGNDFTHFLRDCGIEHRRTPPYSPQCNPVERVNRVIKTMIRQYIDNKHKNWDEKLIEIAFAYNSAQSETTGYSPAYLNYGRELSVPGATYREVPTQKGSNVENRINKIKDALELVKINLAQGFQKQEKHYNLRRRDWAPEVGEKVWKRQHVLSNKANQITSKLAEKYDGPYTVIKKVSPVIFDLKDEKNKILRHIHVKDLKPNKTGSTE